MKWNRILGCLAAGAMFWGCSDTGSDDNGVAGGASGDAGIVAVTDWEVAGVSQKGPFVTGSAVTVQELDGITLKQTGKSFKGTIKSDKGDFAIKDINLESQYAILEASGYYRDEISGKKSSSQVTLRALTDLKDRKHVNINLLTHLEYERVMYLVTEKKKSIAEAKEQAEKEVLATFGIEGDFAESEDLNIFETGDGNAALLAISVLLQSDVDVAGLTERMGEFSISLAEGGSWDDADAKTAIADWACDVDLKGSLSKVRKNVEDWKYADTVPAFEKYVSNFWWDNYGLGVCNTKRENETKRNVNKLSKLYNEYFVCENGRWVIPGDEPKSSSSMDGSSSSKQDDVSSSSEKDAPESSSSDVSSSSVYNPFIPVSSQDTIPELPSVLDFFDSVIYSPKGYMNFADGKQEVWFLETNDFLMPTPRDSLAGELVKALGEKGFSFEDAVLNDSISLAYNDTSYIYKRSDDNIVYKIAITKINDGGAMLCYYRFDVKIVVLKDGFEELSTTDTSSLRYESELPAELSFVNDYVTTKRLRGWSDDSLTTFWYVRHQTDSVKVYMRDNYVKEIEKENVARDSLEKLEKVLLENNFVLTGSDSIGQGLFNSENGYSRNVATCDTLIRRHFYEKETSIAKYEIVVYVGIADRLDALFTYNWYLYGYSVE
ncbi:MAG: hypothetical protein J6U20_02830, partial [Fibrobacter sp.]|nr:hypothetical protein [Fibrobacter sp.]